MKRLTIQILFAFISMKLLAPAPLMLQLSPCEPIEPYRNLIYAIGAVETAFDTLAYNPVEQAVGYFQIRPIRLYDYNKRTGSSYTLQDMFSYEISEKIFIYYAKLQGPYRIEQIAKAWNGSGDKTIIYWEKVKNYLTNQ